MPESRRRVTPPTDRVRITTGLSWRREERSHAASIAAGPDRMGQSPGARTCEHGVEPAGVGVDDPGPDEVRHRYLVRRAAPCSGHARTASPTAPPLAHLRVAWIAAGRGP